MKIQKNRRIDKKNNHRFKKDKKKKKKKKRKAKKAKKVKKKDEIYDVVEAFGDYFAFAETVFFKLVIAFFVAFFTFTAFIVGASVTVSVFDFVTF